jgi:hypothetical protein
MRNIRLCASPSEIGASAAMLGAEAIRAAITAHGEASISVAHGV